MATLDPREVLRVLLEADVDFVVVGGVAAIAHGSSYLTRDFDAVIPITVENCRRILTALSPYSPRFYQAHGKPKVDRTPEELAAFKNLYLDTALGTIDLLGSLPPVGDFARVAESAIDRGQRKATWPSGPRTTRVATMVNAGRAPRLH